MIAKFSPVAELSPKNICIGNGSYDLLCNLNTLYLDNSRTVLCYAPQFSAYVDHVHCIGAQYRAFALKEADNYRFSADAFINFMEQNAGSMVCIENPNNPTGQIIPIDQIDRIASAAERLQMAVVVDEAYGDYMPLENSAVCLVRNHRHLMVTRSFSKGYGMAGIRMGYGIGSPEVVEQLQKLISPFNCNSLARHLSMEMLKDKSYAERLMETTARSKHLIQEKISRFRHLKLAHTSPSTPIMLMITERNVDLSKILAQAGVSSVSGEAYDYIDKNAVRLVICRDVSLLLQILDQVDNELDCREK
ncbi:MAG: histidinol-phosphate aminotransferase family protein [Enterocloster asparagiformis]|nr:histidinol-phosphate aminotransferase family protein [Enterocloster asparagiformis]